MAAVNTDGEGEPNYDEDEFEVEEEEDLDKEASVSESTARLPSLGGTAARPGSRTGSRQGSRQAAGLLLDGGMEPAPVMQATTNGRRRRPGAEPEAPAPAILQMSGELVRTGTAGSVGSGAGRRVVRGKVSVGGSGDDDGYTGSNGTYAGSNGFGGSNGAFGGSNGRRPGTGDSGAAVAASSKPLWLQSDSVPPSRQRRGEGDISPPSDPAGTRSLGSRAKPPLDPDRHLDPFGDLGIGAGIARTQQASRGGRRVASKTENGENVATPSTTPRVGRDEGAERQCKRLQQEIQRLSSRLKEAELFSAQDDGLPKFVLEEVEIGYQIGAGGFSSVHYATWNCTPCALKKIFDPVITEELRGEFENEVRMLRILRHPHIITLMGVCRVPPALSILTEFVEGGSLFDLLHGGAKARHKEAPEPEPTALWPLVQQAASALAYLHKMCVVHRDIKSQNVLFTLGSRPVAKLCDFGLARMKSELGTGTMQYAGTAMYMAPELFAKRKYTECVDTWAFGTMIWEVASTEIPHANLDPADIAHKVQHKEAAGLSVSHSWPKSLKSLIRSTLQVQPESRPSMLEVTEKLGQVIQDSPARF